MRRQAKTIAISAAPIKNGRYGSSAVRLPIQAPLNPSATKTSGPRQQVDASSAVIPPARRAPEPAFLLPWVFSAIAAANTGLAGIVRSEEHTSELQSLMRNSYAVFCLKKKKKKEQHKVKHE